MEELIPFIIIFSVLSSVISALKKKQQQPTVFERRTADAAPRSPSYPETSTMSPSPYADVPVQVIAPTVHPHVEPDCAIHDIPGSLGVTTMEGKDPCHEEQLTLARSVEQSATEKSGLTFDWTGSSMVKAVVMQEVLQRPVQRRAR